ncbi:MAG: hypothetical protein QGH39_12625, partial [Candidatus Thermoplasmatota archaeon]|nr:hypothetical protein [Candidatus Thermoplasmatota archaeon]
MRFDVDAIRAEIENEERERRDGIVAQFQDLRNRIVSVEEEGAEVGSIKMKMLEAKSLIEDERLLEAELIRESCENMLISRIRHRDIFDKLESGKLVGEKAKSLGLDVKRYYMILRQADDLLESEEPATALEMIKVAVEEIERLRALQKMAMDQLLMIQQAITKATEVGMDANKFKRKFVRVISSFDGGDFSKAIRISTENLFNIQNEIQSSEVEKKISELKGSLFKAKENGQVVNREEIMFSDMEKAFKNGDLITYKILRKYLQKSIDVNNQYLNRVQESYDKTGRKLKQLKDNGIWDELVLDIFEQGKTALKEGDYAFADECVHYLEPDVKKMSKLAEKQGISLNMIDSKESLDKAGEMLKILNSLEVNTRNFKLAIRDANELHNKGDYDLVINLLQPIMGQMEKCEKEGVERLRKEVFGLLKKLNHNISVLRDEGIGTDEFDERMDDIQELIDDEDYRNSWATLNSLDDDMTPLIEDVATFNDLLPICRAKFEEMDGKSGFEDAETNYDAIFSLKKGGNLKGAIEKAKSFLEYTAMGGADVVAEPAWDFQSPAYPQQQPGYGQQQQAAQFDQAYQTQQYNHAGPPAQQPAASQQYGIQYDDEQNGAYSQFDGGYSNPAESNYQSGAYTDDPATQVPQEQYYCTQCNMVLQYVN